jgi:hypothetical protein
MSQSKSSESKILDFFKSSWWMLLFWGLCFGIYSHAMHKKKQVCFELQSKLHDLEKAKDLALSEREDLALQIQSQNDPDWIELVLKKRLGLVPEGQKKVYFKQE